MTGEYPELGRLDWGTGPFAVSAEREALRQEIVEAPYDDGLRTAYAQMSIAQGDPRGEYLRLALARESASSQHLAAIDRRLVDLRARYGRAIYAEWFPSPLGRWLGRLVSTSSGAERAGFIHHIGSTSRLEQDELQSLVALTPLESIHFHIRPLPLPLGGARIVDVGPVDNRYLEQQRRTDLRRLSGRWSALPKLSLESCQELRISYTGEDPDFAEQIVKAMPELRHLSLRSGKSAGLRALGALTKLESLSISPGSVDEFREIFAMPGSFPSLRALDISESGVDPAAIAEVVRTRELTKLSMELDYHYDRFLEALDGAPVEELSFYGTPDLMPELHFASFARVKLPSLRSLSISELAAGPDLARLADASWAGQLESLALEGMEISSELLHGLAGANCFSGLHSLSMRSNPLGDRGVCALASSHSLMGVAELALNANGLDASTTRILLDGLRQIEGLDLGSIKLGYQPLAWFEELPNLATLRSYRGSRYEGSATDALQALARSAHASELRHLELSSLEEASAAALTSFIQSPHLAMLGYFPMYTELPDEAMSRILRRFGHRVGLYEGPRLGSLPEPDLDPWWSQSA